MKFSILQLEIRFEHDVVAARQRAMQIAEMLGFKRQDQVKLATAVSEIARNAFDYAGGGKAEFFVEHRQFFIRVTDNGPGIVPLTDVLQGRYHSRTGLGVGILGAKKLVDHFEIETTPGIGTSVLLAKNISSDEEIMASRIGEIADELTKRKVEGPLDELQRQNQELVNALDQIESSRAELQRVNQELEETNRGVVALYAELDEKAGYLRRASELKTRFLSNMTHEFRTPVNSILSLSRILLDRVDGDLTPEQEKQLHYIQAAATDLSQLVNDLLDLAKVEAGKLTVQCDEFEVIELFGALRGTLRPLLAGNSSVRLLFDEPAGIPLLRTDESKLAQILRNLISNALKFTPKGEVRVAAKYVAEGQVEFSVTDTGVGIAPENQAKIFEEFIQLHDVKGNKLPGTGLGLPIAKRLAVLLGGRLSLESEPGKGSRFSVVIPISFAGSAGSLSSPIVHGDRLRYPVLVIDGNTETLFACDRFLKGTAFQALPCRTIKEGRDALDETLPLAVILDVPDQTEKHWAYLRELRADPRTDQIPVFVIADAENRGRAFALGANDFHARPIERDWLLEHLRSVSNSAPRPSVLIIDPDDVSRSFVREALRGTRLEVFESTSEEKAAVLLETHKISAILWNAPDFANANQITNPMFAGVVSIFYDGSKFIRPEQGSTAAGSGAAETLLRQLRHALNATSPFVLQK